MTTEIKKRVYAAEQISPQTIRLMCNGFHLASINYAADNGGTGWKVNPMTPNHPRSRKYWATPESAVASTYGTEARDAIASAIKLAQAGA